MYYRFNIINRFIEKYKFKSYLEIGTSSLTNNFTRINIEKKVSIDPDPSFEADYIMTSDEFFNNNKDFFDIVFIDGLHLCEQVERDINNSLNFLNPGGVIICHDMNPLLEEHQVREFNGGHWHGDVWKTWVKFRCTRNDLLMYVIDTDNGCSVIKRGSQETLNLDYNNVTFNDLDKNRKEYLNVIHLDEFLEMDI